jgi:hypothetical protein
MISINTPALRIGMASFLFFIKRYNEKPDPDFSSGKRPK